MALGNNALGHIGGQGLRGALKNEHRQRRFPYLLTVAIGIGVSGNDNLFGGNLPQRGGCTPAVVIPRQALDSRFLKQASALILRRSRHAYLEGDLFRGAFVFYLVWRLAIDFVKPGVRHGPLTSIQWACVLGLLVYSWEVPRILGVRKVLIDEPT